LILRRNPDSIVIPFDTRAYNVRIDPQDTILSLSERLANYGGGGTDCSIPLAEANKRHSKRPLVGCVLVSDNQSWVTRGRPSFHPSHFTLPTSTLAEWQKFVTSARRHGITDPKLVCIDIQPYGSSQAAGSATGRDNNRILNIGGFSDAVFNVVSSFLSADKHRFVREVGSIEL